MSPNRVMRAIIWCIALASVGWLIGEYYPFTNALASIAKPFSPVRNEVATGYAIVGGVIGLFAGLVVRMNKNDD